MVINKSFLFKKKGPFVTETTKIFPFTVENEAHKEGDLGITVTLVLHLFFIVVKHLVVVSYKQIIITSPETWLISILSNTFFVCCKISWSSSLLLYFCDNIIFLLGHRSVAEQPMILVELPLNPAPLWHLWSGRLLCTSRSHTFSSCVRKHSTASSISRLTGHVILGLLAWGRNGLLNLQRKIHHWATLRDAAQGNDVHMWGEIQSQVVRSHSSTGFYQCSWELLLQSLSFNMEFLAEWTRGSGGAFITRKSRSLIRHMGMKMNQSTVPEAGSYPAWWYQLLPPLPLWPPLQIGTPLQSYCWSHTQSEQFLQPGQQTSGLWVISTSEPLTEAIISTVWLRSSTEAEKTWI